MIYRPALLVLLLCAMSAGEQPLGAPAAWPIPEQAEDRVAALARWADLLARERPYEGLTSVVLDELRPRAEAGDPLAIDVLFYAAYMGYGMQPDWPLARTWMERGLLVGAPLCLLQHGRDLIGHRFGVTLDPTPAERELGLAYLEWSVEVLGQAAATQPSVSMFLGTALLDLRRGDEAMQALRRAAEAGWAPAMSTLASLLARVAQTPAQRAEVLAWHERAAASGLPYCIFVHGVARFEGLALTQDLQGGINQIIRAAESGWPPAWRYVGNIAFRGQGTPRNIPAALDAFLRAANGGFRAAWLQVGICRLTAGGVPWEPVVALRDFHKAAACGHAMAMAKIAESTLEGLGTRADPRAAIVWARRSAERGLHHGEELVLRCLRHGGEPDPDGQRAADMAREMLEEYNNCGAATLALGLAYLEGRGAPLDPATGYIYLRSAADREDPDAEAAFHYGSLLLEGRPGLPADPVRGEAILRKGMIAISLHQLACMQRLGEYFLRPEASPAQRAEAWQLLRTAAGRDHGRAAALCGLICLDGLGRERDPAEARRWINRGIRARDPMAYYLRGRHAEEIEQASGEAVLKDYQHAWDHGYQEPAVLAAIQRLAPQVAADRQRAHEEAAAKREAARRPAPDAARRPAPDAAAAERLRQAARAAVQRPPADDHGQEQPAPFNEDSF